MKSDASVYLELVHAVYNDACAKISADVSDVRDLVTIRSRVESRGISFLTITLPDFCRDFERSLREGRVDPTYFAGFRKYGALPAFLRGMLGRLFDRETGRILDENPDTPILVAAVRAICLLFKKVAMPCRPAKVDAALDNFVKVERELNVFEWPQDSARRFREVSYMLWCDLFSDFTRDRLVPRHGPGATAERISANQKFVWRRWHERLEPYFPFYSYGYSVMAAVSPSRRDSREKRAEMVKFVPREEEQPVRVITVPKTLKSPRIIAIEPVCMQYTQQALQSYLYGKIEGRRPSSGPARGPNFALGHVNFTDQSVNRRMALWASETGRLVTIDLSDASDRVPLVGVGEMLWFNPDLLGATMACRSEHADVPNRGKIRLAKFASMGSALCFPIEAMYFYTVIVLALLEKYNLPVSYASVQTVTRDVYVYGDDILVAADDAEAVLSGLQKYNCKPSPDKTFTTGRFRESCGMDAYAGVEVTPLYVRQPLPENRQQADRLVSWIATANLFALKGFETAAELMFGVCERILGKLPRVGPRSPALGRITFSDWEPAARPVRVQPRPRDSCRPWYQRPEIKALVPSLVYRSDMVDGYSALQKSLLALERGSVSDVSLPLWDQLLNLSKGSLQETTRDELHLKRSVQRGAVSLKSRWVPVQ